MSIRREKAFPIFEALLDAGYRPRLTGMRVTTENQDRHKRHWEPGTEGYFLKVSIETNRAAIASKDMAFFDELASTHGLTAYFSTYSDDDGDQFGATVEFA